MEGEKEWSPEQAAAGPVRLSQNQQESQLGKKFWEPDGATLSFTAAEAGPGGQPWEPSQAHPYSSHL